MFVYMGTRSGSLSFLLLTDVDMPRMAGSETRGACQGSRPELRILLMPGGAASSRQGWCSALTVVPKQFNTVVTVAQSSEQH